MFQVHFQMAHFLLSYAVDNDALLEVESELLIARNLAPTESLLFAYLGEVYCHLLL